MPEGDRPTVLAQVVQAAGLLAGVVVLVYLAGGTVVYWRLWLEGYNNVATVAQLPVSS